MVTTQLYLPRTVLMYCFPRQNYVVFPFSVSFLYFFLKVAWLDNKSPGCLPCAPYDSLLSAARI